MTTTLQFQRLAQQRFRQINPEASSIDFTWEFVSDGFVDDRIGSGATMHGCFVAKALGHRAKRVIATMERGAKDVSLR